MVQEANNLSPPDDFFAENFKFERDQRKYSKKQIADILGVSGSTVSLWESEKTHPTMPLFLLICQYFSRSPTEMLLQRLEFNANPTGSPNRVEQLEAELQSVKKQLQTLQEQFERFTLRQQKD
jgi:transcriptional regulator with XRE-family HTH domain